MSIKTQLRLGQMTGSFGNVPGGITDTRDASSAASLAAIAIQSGSMVGIMSEMASALKRINGGGTFAGQGAGEFNHANSLFKNFSNAATKVTIGNNANQQDAILAFDGNAQDFHVGLDDTDDKLKIGLGTTPGTTPNMELNSADRDVKFFGDVEIAGGKITLTNGSLIDSETVGELQLTEDLVIVTGDLKVEGNDIKASDGTTAITMSGADVTIAGDLTVSGDTTTVNTAQLAVEDPLIQLASGQNNTTDAVDIGFYGRYGDSGTFKFAGLFRDQNDSGNFHLFKDTQEDLSSVSVVNRGGTGYTKGDLIVNSLDADGGVTIDNITIDGTEIDLSSGDLTIDVAGDIILDADGKEVIYKDGGTTIGKIHNYTDAGGTDFRFESVAGDIHIHPALNRSTLLSLNGGGEGVAFINPGNGASYAFITGSAEGLILSASAANDILFQANTGGNSVVVAKVDSSAGALFLPSGRAAQFGNAGESISGDGTDLTIASSAKLNLTATSDVHIPKNVGLVFDDNASEKIESDDTDLTISSGAKIKLTATSDVELPNSVGIIFGDSGEKIEGDGTDLTINSSGLLNMVVDGLSLNSAGNVTFDSDSFRFDFVDNAVEKLRLDLDGSNHPRFSARATGSDEANIVFRAALNGTETKVMTLDGANLALIMETSNAGGTNPGVISFASDMQEAIYGDGSKLILRSGNTNFNMPTSAGGNGDVLTSDGAGNLTFQASGGAASATKVTGTANAAVNAGTVLSGVDNFAVFDMRALDGSLAPNALDVFVNGQLLLSCSSGDFSDNAATIAANTTGDYYLSENFAANNGGDIKFTFDLEKDDVVVVAIRG